MKAIPCYVTLRARFSGEETFPHVCKSVSEALKYVNGMGMYYYIYDLNGNLIKKGYAK